MGIIKNKRALQFQFFTSPACLLLQLFPVHRTGQRPQFISVLLHFFVLMQGKVAGPASADHLAADSREGVRGTVQR